MPDRDVKWLLRLNVYLLVNGLLVAVGLGLVFAEGDEWVKDLGTGLAASGLVGLILVYEKRVEHMLDEKRNRLFDAGLTDYIPKRNDPNVYVAEIERCTDRFEILGQSLVNFVDQVAKPNDRLKRVIDRGVTVRILVMHPESKYVRVRALEEGSKRSNIAKEIGEFAKECSALGVTAGSLKFYRTTPTLNFQRIDEKLYVGPYFVGFSASSTPAFVLSPKSVLANAYEDHFKEVWEQAESADKVFPEHFPAPRARTEFAASKKV